MMEAEPFSGGLMEVGALDEASKPPDTAHRPLLAPSLIAERIRLVAGGPWPFV